MRKRTINSLALSLALGVLLPWNAYAIPIGTLDSSEYPYVGFSYMDGIYGSGVLIAPDVVLTAGHVAELYQPGSSLFITSPNPFNNPEPLANVASSVVHPLYDELSFSFDIGLLFLDETISLSEYATLWPSDPALLLGTPVEAVGYGGDQRRKVGFGSAQGLYDSYYLVTELLAEPGDSGGGLFIEVGGQNVLAGIMSFITPLNAYHSSVGYSRSFIDAYVPGASWFGESVIEEPMPVPEPAMLALLALGLFALLPGRNLRRRRLLLYPSEQAATTPHARH